MLTKQIVINKSNALFLLGGYDLEMLEIRKLLEKSDWKEGKHFFDKKLSWGAKWSDYQKHFESDKIKIGIELIEDIYPSQPFINIDHHNKIEHYPASIIQVAELLGVELDRWQQLVAANDCGYIPGMQKVGATEKEVRQIRAADRAAQGVTEEEEKLAVTSIDNHLQIKNGVTVVHSLTSKFSPIADRLHGKTEDNLLIYSDEELTYYGINKPLIEKHLNEKLASGQYYSGGGEHGFWGIGKGVFSSEKLYSLTNQIIEIFKKHT